MKKIVLRQRLGFPGGSPNGVSQVRIALAMARPIPEHAPVKNARFITSAFSGGNSTTTRFRTPLETPPLL